MVNVRRMAGLGGLILLLSACPTAVNARGSAAPSCPPAKSHALPSGSSSTKVISFGVKGGSLRPWSVSIALDGSIQATSIATLHQQLSDPKNALGGVLALADAQGFFSMKKTIGCLGAAGNPDASSHFISIHTASGTKRVQELGSCSGTEKFDQLFAVIWEAAGIGG